MAGSPRKLIVVDDDPVDVRFVMRAFSDAGSPVEIVHVADADIASDRLDREAFDYILLDINMPGTSGMDLLKRLRARARTAVTPVIMLSSSASMVDVSRAYENGANAYAVKPSTRSGYREFAEGFTRFWVDVAVSP
ncbi:response regulator [Shinella zoogloeoides]|uniref:Response regulator n=1 Tax=Shinella zoogloeoides TaxID=352475 RepID=A0A6N8T9N5_SHIZO|nr:response regulator [Shinella zoogloeoides]MXN98875.1 response regulator [Shinella zoogloeoides]UEX83321.1 response regulator [Shinella zoogloeoides]